MHRQFISLTLHRCVLIHSALHPHTHTHTHTHSLSLSLSQTHEEIEVAIKTCKPDATTDERTKFLEEAGEPFTHHIQVSLCWPPVAQLWPLFNKPIVVNSLTNYICLCVYVGGVMDALSHCHGLVGSSLSGSHSLPTLYWSSRPVCPLVTLAMGVELCVLYLNKG